MSAPDFSKIAGMSKTIATSSALNPGLFLSLVTMPIGATAALWTTNPILAMIFASVAVAPPIIVLFQIVFFTIWDRDRLHNEKHIEKKMLIQRMPSEIGDRANAIPIATDSVLENNPALVERGNV